MLTAKEKQKLRSKKHQDKLMSTKEGCIKRRFIEVRSRCNKREIAFNLSLEYLISIAPEKCPILNLELIWRNETGKIENNSASLDRINPNAGYIQGNVQWLSNLANTMKNKATPEQLLKFADWINANIKM